MSKEYAWQPIETAPKDGREIIGLFDGCYFVDETDVCHGSGCTYVSGSSEVSFSMDVKSVVFLNGFWITSDGHVLSDEDSNVLKKWHPMPIPPVPDQEQKAENKAAAAEMIPGGNVTDEVLKALSHCQMHLDGDYYCGTLDKKCLETVINALARQHQSCS
jgi:hypothetical protein